MTEPSEEVKEVERRYKETIDKMQQLVDRMKTERRSQAEFEQYAKEHRYIISTTNIIEQIRQEIDELEIYYDNDYFSGNQDAMFKCNDVLQIIDKYRER